MDTKKLRQKILDLAFSGKLVPQDPNNEPAIELLKLINPKFEACDNSYDTNDIPKGWCLTQLKKACADFIVPQRDKPTRFDGDIPWCRIEDIEGKYLNGSLSNQKVSMDLIKEMNMRICPVGTVLCSCSASLGIQAITTVPCCTNQTFIGIVPNKETLYEDYLFYFLKSRTKLFYELGTGTTIKYISRTKFENLTISLPPLIEQHRIVNEIERWFAVIDTLESNEADLLKAIDKAKSKILDLAIHGKLVPQDPNDEPAIELLKRINPKFEACDNVLDTTQLPDSWCWAKLESISTDSADGPFGSNLKKEHYTTNKEVRIIQLSNIGDEGWREENTKYTTFEHLKDISRSEVLPNDIVIAKMMPAGRAILCPNNEHKYVLSSDAVKFHIVDNIDCRYILYAINSDMFRKQVYENVQGVTRVRTSLQKLRKYCLPLPPYQEQLRIVAKIEELFSVLDSIKESLA